MSDQKKDVGCGLWVLAGLSFIPLLGVLAGLAAIVLGLINGTGKGRIVAVIGGLGILFTIVLYGSLFYFGFAQRGGVYDGLRTQLNQQELNQLAPMVETYKVGHGAYPDSLETLQKSVPPNTAVSILDNELRDGEMTPTRTFFYQRVGCDHYYLRSVGRDGQPFTKDDTVPQVDPAAASKLGLLTERNAALETDTKACAGR